MHFLRLALFLCFLPGANLYALPKDSLVALPKEVSAYYIQAPIKIDGELDEGAWALAPRVSDFIQNAPNPGKPSRLKTEVAFLYDDNAIYIGAWLHDVSRDSVIKTLSERDQNDNADVFAVGLDTYNDDQNAFLFKVTSAGVQLDSRISAAGYDNQWNAVWYSEVSITDSGWFVEMKIPFSALRFSEKPEQAWGVNFWRTIRRYRETSSWNFTNPLIPGEVNQYGNATGIKDIKSPLRLSFTPYVSAYYNTYSDKPNDVFESGQSFNGGMDVKYGLNDAFTLDMTLIPDFGQVQSDNQVLNVTPYEVQYNEFRQFFTEGTEIYNKAGLFYSRRVGGVPVNYGAPYGQLNKGDEVTENPATSKLVNATKLTGRTRQGTGIGLFNAVTQPTYATITDSTGGRRRVLTDPLTNYNVFVLDQNLKNNSFVNLTNTSVMRSGQAYDANVTGLSTKLNTKNNAYGLNASGVVSQQYGYPAADTTTLGHKAYLGLQKQSGNVTYGANYNQESDKYDPNDLGYLQNNNSREFIAYLNYNEYDPGKHFLNYWTETWISYQRLYAPNAYAGFFTGFSMGGTTRKWVTMSFWGEISPGKSYDYFEPRVSGRYYSLPAYVSSGLYVSTDYRKKLAVDAEIKGVKFDYNKRHEWGLMLEPRFRFSDKISMILTGSYSSQHGEQGSALDLDGNPTILNDTIIFAIRNRQTYENVLSLKYIFTNRMALNFRVRHYWSKLEYNDFFSLNTDGSLGESAYAGITSDGQSLHNTSFNAFNVDLVYTWVFAPGSEVRVVWKNSIYDFSQAVTLSYKDDFTRTLKSPQNNSFSVKVIYYLDALMLRRKKS